MFLHTTDTVYVLRNVEKRIIGNLIMIIFTQSVKYNELRKKSFAMSEYDLLNLFIVEFESCFHYSLIQEE